MSVGGSTLAGMDAGERAVRTDEPVRREPHYDPWLDLRRNWPQVQLRVEPMEGDLLGELRHDGRLIAIRAGTSAAQSRCTLAHEIVHLERGVRDCGPWALREELVVHTVASRRLIHGWELIEAIRGLGGTSDQGALAHQLEVDSETLALRLAGLTRTERQAVRRALIRAAPLWAVA